jgi:hypothetical protein
MNLTNLSTEALKAHIELLKSTIPQSFEKPLLPETREDKMYKLMRKSLSVIEAVYFQNSEMFTSARMEAYHEIIESLNDLGFDYIAHPELLKKYTTVAFVNAKMPMKKAGKRKLDQPILRKKLG